MKIYPLLLGRTKVPFGHLLVGHDHTEYQWKHLAPGLSKGWLSEDERRALSAYEAGVFDGTGALRPGAVPQFQRDASGGRIGTVSEPRLGP